MLYKSTCCYEPSAVVTLFNMCAGIHLCVYAACCSLLFHKWFDADHFASLPHPQLGVFSNVF